MSFRVTVNTNFGEEVVLCGSLPALGSWNPAEGLRMATNKDLYPDWIAKIRLPKVGGESFKYKYVIKSAAGRWLWEEGIPDRLVTFRDDQVISVADG